MEIHLSTAMAALQIPAYDTDWAATGPLIEKYKLDVDSGNRDDINGWTARAWLPNDVPTETVVCGAGHDRRL